MKHHLTTSTLFAGLALAIPASAAPEAANPAPKDAAPAGEVQFKIKAADQAEAKAADQAEAKAFLGLGTSEVPGFLGKHLKLKDGTGVLVRDLYPDSPAETAGIAVDDVITEVGGKAVGSHQDLIDQISAHKPGEELQLKFIHDGDARDATVKLGEFPAELAQDEPAADDNGFEGMMGIPGNLPPEIQKQLREAMKNGIKGMRMGGREIQPGMGRIEIQPGGLGQVPDDDGVAAPDKPGINFKMASSINLMDDQGSIEMRNHGDGSEVKVRDKAGKEIWSGPWVTDQDKAAAPPEIRERIERLNVNVLPQMGGMKINPNRAPKRDAADEQDAAPKEPKAPENEPENAPAKP